MSALHFKVASIESGQPNDVENHIGSEDQLVTSILFLTRFFMAIGMPLKNAERGLNTVKSCVWVLLWIVFGGAFVFQWIFNYGGLASTMINVDMFLFVFQFGYYKYKEKERAKKVADNKKNDDDYDPPEEQSPSKLKIVGKAFSSVSDKIKTVAFEDEEESDGEKDDMKFLKNHDIKI